MGILIPYLYNYKREKENYKWRYFMAALCHLFYFWSSSFICICRFSTSDKFSFNILASIHAVRSQRCNNWFSYLSSYKACTSGRSFSQKASRSFLKTGRCCWFRNHRMIWSVFKVWPLGDERIWLIERHSWYKNSN